MARKGSTVVASIVVATALVLLVIAIIGVFAPGRAGQVATVIFGSYSPWIVIVAGLLAVLALVARRQALALGTLGVTLAVIALLAGLAVLTPQSVTAISEGVPIDPRNSLGISLQRPQAPDRIEIYATADGQELKAGIWLPDQESLRPVPAIVWVHGGGFVSGGFGDDSVRQRELADAGYPVISIDYRLAPPPRWRDANGDVACALSWVREQSDELNVDPDRIVLGGESVGGTLALNVAYGLGDQRKGVQPVGSSCGSAPRPPAAVFAIYPAVDLTRPSPAGEWRYQEFLGGTPQDAQEAYAYASPASRVRRDLPRTLLITGGSDRIVDPEVTREFATRVRRNGNEIRQLSYPFGGHDYDQPATLGSAVNDRAIMRWLRQWFPQEA